MEEQAQLELETIQEPVESERQLAETETEDDFDYGPPRGTIAFLALMLTGYVIYYIIHYVEIFVLR